MPSITQTHPTQQTQYDAYGWPINPATGVAYDFADLVADPSLPLPKDAAAVLAARARATGDAPKAKRRTASRRRTTGSRRTHAAAAVLARSVTAGPFDAGMRATARRMDELAAEGDVVIPFLGEPRQPRDTTAAGLYGLQPAF